MPKALALFSSIISLNPVQSIIGISALISESLEAGSTPFMFGMVMSVMTRSNLSGLALKASNACTFFRSYFNQGCSALPGEKWGAGNRGFPGRPIPGCPHTDRAPG